MFGYQKCLNRILEIILLTVIIKPPGAPGLWWSEKGVVELDAERVCRRTGRLGEKQQLICKTERQIVNAISGGVTLGLEQCQEHFKHRLWNCTSHKKTMSKIVKRNTREQAVLRAITSAGAMHGIMEVCARGEIPLCSCDNFIKSTPLPATDKSGVDEVTPVVEPPRPTVESFQFSGCQDHIGYAYSKSKEFVDVDVKKSGKDFITKVNLHNYEAGRLASKKYLEVACKCHGLSGTCALRTCWLRLPTLSSVTDRLKDKYDGAIEVTVSNQAEAAIIPAEGQSVKHQEPEDLIFSRKSINYCKSRPAKGILGTTGRECDPHVDGTEGCGVLCCGRGYVSRKENITENCKCRFTWCCAIKCESCTRTITVYTCR